jgi:hypothetical protein
VGNVSLRGINFDDVFLGHVMKRGVFMKCETMESGMDRDVGAASVVPLNSTDGYVDMHDLRVGKVYTVNIRTMNWSDTPQTFIFQGNFMMDCEGHIIDYEEVEDILVIGSMAWFVQQLEVDQEWSHEFRVMFMSKGTYKLYVHGSSMDNGGGDPKEEVGDVYRFVVNE